MAASVAGLLGDVLLFDDGDFYAAEELASLPEPQYHLMPCDPFEVEIDPSLDRLAEEADLLINERTSESGP